MMIPLRNTQSRFGWPAIVMHWLAAMAIFGLFGLGWWMVQLDYYSDWYRTGPHIHKSIGLLLLALMVLRWVWRLCNLQPAVEGKAWEQHLAHWMHRLLYGIVFVVMISGYLISTADGSAISVFNWFEIPALLADVEGQEDIAGAIHEYLAWALVIAAGLHALAALKHHFVDKDRTLVKMLGKE